MTVARTHRPSRRECAGTTVVPISIPDVASPDEGGGRQDVGAFGNLGDPQRGQGGFVHEAVLQLRHEAELRQVADASTAVVTTGGGTPSGVLLLTRDGA